MATIGFCVGARAAYRTVMRFPERFVAGALWHPSFLVDDQPDSPHLTAGGLARPLFIGIGEADAMQPLASHLPFLDAVRSLPGVEIATYPGADHGYTWPGWPSYDEAAANASFAATLKLFRQALAPPSNARTPTPFPRSARPQPPPGGVCRAESS